MAAATAGMAFYELRMINAATPAEHATALRFFHVTAWLNFIAVFTFVRLHLRSGWLWLGWAAVGVRTLSLMLNFLTGVNLNFLEVIRLREIPFLGGTVVVPEGRMNPCMAVGQLSLILLIIFVVNAAYALWKRGDLQRLPVACAIAGFVVLASIVNSASVYRFVDLPQIGSLFFLGMLVAMAFELSLETLRASEIAAELKSTREEKTAEVAHLGRVATFNEVSVTLAHEINQPLGMILSNAQAAQRLLAKDTPDLPKIREILGDIVDADLRASEVIKHMRAMLKRGEVLFQPLDLNEVAREVLQLLRTNLRDRGLSVTTEFATRLPLVFANRIQLQQVLLNLIINACEAMDDNPPEERRLEITTIADRDGVRVIVTDSGRGLPEDVEVLFQPFHTTKEEGLGMGLAICRSITAAHQGELRAENNRTFGASFHLILPASEGPL